MHDTTKVEEAVELLQHKASPRRRSGAKRLRKLKDPAACPQLLQALEKEVQDPRTWETQYQMIMALGECGCTDALSYLEQLARQSFEATMIYVALGDAIVRLGRAYKDDADPVLRLTATNNDMLVDGAFRAVAMLRLRLNEAAIYKIIKYVSQRSLNDPLRFWVAAAAAGWSGVEVAKFLDDCSRSPRNDVREAAIASQQQKYLKWDPL
ncbi:MAG TPA: HEAT repeat domain-containing protein [Chloroflexia bacterium]